MTGFVQMGHKYVITQRAMKTCSRVKTSTLALFLFEALINVELHDGNNNLFSWQQFVCILYVFMSRKYFIKQLILE